jgi:predicted nucleotidyltransferase
MIDLKKLSHIISEYLKDKEDVIAAYIYGSIGSEGEGKQSDLDIALLTHPFRNRRESYKARIHYLHEIQRLVKMDVDLIFLQEVGELLAYQVFKKGRIIFERDKRSHVSFKASKIIQCLDFQQIEKGMQKGMINAMRRERNG